MFGWGSVWSVIVSQTLFNIPANITALVNEHGIILFCCIAIGGASFDYVLSATGSYGWKVACILAAVLIIILWFILFNPNNKLPPKPDIITVITTIYCSIGFLYCFVLKSKLFYIEHLNSEIANKKIKI